MHMTNKYSFAIKPLNHEQIVVHVSKVDEMIHLKATVFFYEYSAIENITMENFQDIHKNAELISIYDFNNNNSIILTYNKPSMKYHQEIILQKIDKSIDYLSRNIYEEIQNITKFISKEMNNIEDEIKNVKEEIKDIRDEIKNDVQEDIQNIKDNIRDDIRDIKRFHSKEIEKMSKIIDDYKTCSCDICISSIGYIKKVKNISSECERLNSVFLAYKTNNNKKYNILIDAIRLISTTFIAVYLALLVLGILYVLGYISLSSICVCVPIFLVIIAFILLNLVVNIEEQLYY
jgi:gas vesicle protein